jgi:putative isomerase
MNAYADLKRQLARGWNTWNTRSVLSHVHLPEGVAINLGVKDYASGGYLKEALIGRHGAHEEQVHPGPRAYDDSYTDLTLRWGGQELRVQSALDGDDLLLLVTPLKITRRPATLAVEGGILWNRPGTVRRDGETLVADLPDGSLTVYATRATIDDPYIAAQGPYLALPVDGPIGLSTGRRRTLDEIHAGVARGEATRRASLATFGDLADVYTAMQTCLAWDTVYDPLHDRVISPVSRIWSVGSGGYVLFEWDTYFAAWLASIDNKALAYANAIEITRERAEAGFVPNFVTATGMMSRDRSQPPVGARTVLELYRRFGDRWFLEELFPALLAWNRWWHAHRTTDGLLCWGSDPFAPVVDNVWELNGVNERYGAALESGLDNSPMYDDIPFDATRHQLMLQDAGLTGLYIMDCRALAEIAGVLGRPEEDELTARAADLSAHLERLWDEATGIYRNRRTDTGEFSPRLSPTNFYPLLGDVPTPAQVERMLAEHLYNPAEFWGDWILPSIARNDPAYPEQDYWRGRIWAPMNFLVYLGLRNYDVAPARTALAEKSRALLLKEWHAHGHVHENYSGDTGEGCDKGNSDRFYHWGGLLGLPAFYEAGWFDRPVADE